MADRDEEAELVAAVADLGLAAGPGGGTGGIGSGSTGGLGTKAFQRHLEDFDCGHCGAEQPGNTGQA